MSVGDTARLMRTLVFESRRHVIQAHAESDGRQRVSINVNARAERRSQSVIVGDTGRSL